MHQAVQVVGLPQRDTAVAVGLAIGRVKDFRAQSPDGFLAQAKGVPFGPNQVQFSGGEMTVAQVTQQRGAQLLKPVMDVVGICETVSHVNLPGVSVQERR